MNTIRLACRLCDRDDFDGVAETPLDWFDVQEVQTHNASLRQSDNNRPDGNAGVNDWFTNLGVCPECYEAEIRPVIVR